MTVAERILRRVFAAVRTPIRFQLWDGTVVRVGPGESGFAIVFRSPDVFRRILRDPTPLRFGEAYIAGEIDIEGDILDAMGVADDIEHMRVPLPARLAALADLLRV